MAGREVSVKKYVVKLSEGERQHLNVRIPTIPAMHSDRMPSTRSDLMPATIPI